MASANGEPLLSATITRSEVGPLQADVEIDTAREGAADEFVADETTGRIAVTLEHEGVEFVCTVVRGEFRGERYEARLVGGAGGLDTVLPSKSYLSAVGVELGRVLGDIMRATGEALSTTINEGVLDRRLIRWTRARGTAWQALDTLSESTGLVWRTLPDGTIWFGRDAFAESDVDAVEIVNDPKAAAIILAAPEGGAGPLLLEPGSSFAGRQVLEVVHKLTEGTFRTVANTQTLRRAFKAARAPLDRDIQHSRVYAARVSSQNADGTLNLVPDGGDFKGTGVPSVPILLGVPGTVQVPEGSRVTLLFEGGDPQKPRALLWSTSLLTRLNLGAGNEALAVASYCDARIGALQGALDTLIGLFNAHVHSGVTTGGGTSGPPGTPDTPLGALDTVASTKIFGEA